METSVEKQHIVRTPGTCGGKPRIAGTRIRVQDVYVRYEVMGQSPQEIVAMWPHLTLGNIHAALAYYYDHQAEIQQEVIDGEKFVAEMREKMGPGPMEKNCSNVRLNH